MTPILRLVGLQADIQKTIIYSNRLEDIFLSDEESLDTCHKHLSNLYVPIRIRNLSFSYSCKLSIKNIIVTAESDVENAFTFVVETSAEFANSSISDYLQHGQVTVLEEKGIWLVDNFYENQPDLYNQISRDVTPIVA